MRWKSRYRKYSEPQVNNIEKDHLQDRHITFKMCNIQNNDRTLKVSKKQQVTLRGKPIRINIDFLVQILKVRKPWNNVYQALKENNCQPG